MTKIKKILKNNIVTFPLKLKEGEREVEAIVFAAAEPLDIDTIERVTEITGGQSFEALDQQALKRAYHTIALLEPELYETISFRPRQSLHWLPLSVALIFYTLYHGYKTWRVWHGLRRKRGFNAL